MMKIPVQAIDPQVLTYIILESFRLTFFIISANRKPGGRRISYTLAVRILKTTLD